MFCTFSVDPVVDDLVTISIVLAIFNGSIVGMLTLGRIFYSSGRDKAWPGPISGWMVLHPSSPQNSRSRYGVYWGRRRAYHCLY